MLHRASLFYEALQASFSVFKQKNKANHNNKKPKKKSHNPPQKVLKLLAYFLNIKKFNLAKNIYCCLGGSALQWISMFREKYRNLETDQKH